MSQTPPNTSSSHEAERLTQSQSRDSLLSPRRTPLPGSSESSPGSAGRPITESSQRCQSVNNTTGSPSRIQERPHRSIVSTSVPEGLFGRGRASPRGSGQGPSSSHPPGAGGPSDFGMAMMENPITYVGEPDQSWPSLPTNRVALHEEILRLEGHHAEVERAIEQATRRFAEVAEMQEEILRLGGRRDEAERHLNQARQRLVEVEGRLAEARRRLAGAAVQQNGSRDDLDVSEYDRPGKRG